MAGLHPEAVDWAEGGSAVAGSPQAEADWAGVD